MAEARALTVARPPEPIDCAVLIGWRPHTHPGDRSPTSVTSLAARFIAGRLFHWASGLLLPHCRQRPAFRAVDPQRHAPANAHVAWFFEASGAAPEWDHG